jgi:hypothetical protein
VDGDRNFHEAALAYLLFRQGVHPCFDLGGSPQTAPKLPGFIFADHHKTSDIVLKHAKQSVDQQLVGIGHNDIRRAGFQDCRVRAGVIRHTVQHLAAGDDADQSVLDIHNWKGQVSDLGSPRMIKPYSNSRINTIEASG